jgi:hypothetical protein
VKLKADEECHVAMEDEHIGREERGSRQSRNKYKKLKEKHVRSTEGKDVRR